MSEPLHVLKLEEAIITWHESGNTNFILQENMPSTLIVAYATLKVMQIHAMYHNSSVHLSLQLII